MFNIKQFVYKILGVSLARLSCIFLVSACTHVLSSMILTDAKIDRDLRDLGKNFGYRASLITYLPPKYLMSLGAKTIDTIEKRSGYIDFTSLSGFYEVNILKTQMMLLSDVTAMRMKDSSDELDDCLESRCPDSDSEYVERELGLKWRLLVVPAVGLYVIELQKLEAKNQRLTLAFHDMQTLLEAFPLFKGVLWEELAQMLVPITPQGCSDLKFVEHQGEKLVANCTMEKLGFSYSVDRYVSFDNGFYFPKLFSWHGSVTTKEKANMLTDITNHTILSNSPNSERATNATNVLLTNPKYHQLSEISDVMFYDYCFMVRGAAPIAENRQTNDIFRKALNEIQEGIQQGRIKRVSKVQGQKQILEFIKVR